MTDQTIFKLSVIRTSNGFMIEDGDGDYYHDHNQDNCFDSLSEVYDVIHNHFRREKQKLKTYSVRVSANMIIHVEASSEVEAHVQALEIANKIEPDWAVDFSEMLEGE
jgi:hypothetical protein